MSALSGSKVKAAFRAIRQTAFLSENNRERLDLIQTAIGEARAEERRKVVEWLREEDAARPGDNWLGWIAGRIEKGDHRG